MIILASQSETRRSMLKAAGVVFTATNSPLDEAALQATLESLSPKQIANALASAKASALDEPSHNALIVGVDQTLELDGQVMHKPKSRGEAKQQLLRLNGKTHHLHTAYAIFRNRQQVATHCESSTLTVRTMTTQFINDYMAATPDEILTTVGCYQLEGLGIQLMEATTGDYFSILGLPLLPLLAHLRDLGELST